MKLCEKIPVITTCSGWERLTFFIATGAGLGFCPVAPGTSGSLPGIVLAWLMSGTKVLHKSIILTVIIAIAVMTADVTARIMRQKDPRLIVVDEIVGMTIALAWIPLNLTNIAIQLLIFRCLDIWKPSLIGWLDRNLPGGWGIVMDDVLAGITANLLWQTLNIVTSFYI